MIYDLIWRDPAYNLTWNTLETFLKHPWHFPKTSLKHIWNFLETPWNFLETLCKHYQNFPETSLKHPLSFKHLLNFLETPLKLFRTGKNTKREKRDEQTDRRADGRMYRQPEWQCHFLSCSSQLKFQNEIFDLKLA